MPRKPPPDFLEVVLRPDSPFWQIAGFFRGRRIRKSTGTTVRARAEDELRRVEAELWSRHLAPTAAPGWTFEDALDSYLAAKIEVRPAERRYLGKLLDHFEGVPIKSINQLAVDGAYAAVLTPRAGFATRLRAVLTPLRAVLRHAARRDMCALPMFESPPGAPPNTDYLTPGQAAAIVREAAPHARPLFLFLFCTGARMSEALELDWERVDLRGARAILTVKGARGHARRRERHVDLPPAAVAALSAIPGGRTGRVFRPSKGLKPGVAYRDTDRTGGGQVKTAWAGACHRAGVPGRWREWTHKGSGEARRAWVPAVTPHGTRHSWASWHYAVHKDLLLLKREGDWRTVGQCERYAHLLPGDYREDVLEFWGLPGPVARQAAG